MKLSFGPARGFVRDERGSFAILTAFAALMLAGAVGVGIDTYRLENARTALDQAVNLTCDRISNADIAIYPTADERVAMAQKFAEEQVKRTALDPKRTAMTATKDGADIAVTGSTTVKSSFMSVLGFKEMSGKSSRSCKPPSDEPPTKACTKDDLVYLNPGTFQTAAGTLIHGTANYTATLYDATGKIRKRQVIGGGSGDTAAFLQASTKDDWVVVQPFNADGTTPAPCNPTPPTSCSGDPSTCPPPPPSCTGDPSACPPPPPTGVCTKIKVEELANALYPPSLWRNLERQWTHSPAVEAASATGVLQIEANRSVYSVPLASNFEPEVYFPRLTYNVNATDSGEDFLKAISRAIVSGILPNNVRLFVANDRSANRAYIFRVIERNSAAWEINGQCVLISSPIVLDLIGKGEITTTGVSSARYAIPQHRVNATVDFDMGGAGKTVRTEWITGNGQALLVDNRDGKAATEMNGRRLFGNLGGHENGYTKLAELDKDQDGKVAGAEIAGLAAWIDDGDAIVQPGEVKTLAELGLTELSTRLTEVPTDDGGAHLRSTAVMNGKTIMTEDVWFGVDLSSKVSDARAYTPRPRQ